MANTPLNSFIQNEVSRLAEHHKVDSEVLLGFAQFVIANHKKKDKTTKTPAKQTKDKAKVKALSMAEMKKAIFNYFEVKNTTELKKSGSFKMATNGMEPMNFNLKATWESLYRKFVGIIPGEEQQEGYGCINGIDIFKYFRPWQVFALDPKSASSEDIKNAYRELSKKYHPDAHGTGDAKIFDRIHTMYQSISAGA